MRILIHDYSGHPFQVQLSRTLAARGHAVRHVYCASFQTPRGNLKRQPNDPEGFEIRAVALDRPFLKDAFFRRRRQEIAIGQLVAGQISDFGPDVVISSNAPLDAQAVILKEAQRQNARFVFWLQDIYSEAIRRILSKKIPGAGTLVGLVYQNLEYRLLRQSDHVVPIAEDFVPLLKRRGVDANQITVVENWAPLTEIVPQPRDNDWARQHMPQAGLRVVYSGTLGYKHNSGLLLELAKHLEGHVFVFSEGRAAESLRQKAADQGVGNLHVRGWVPFEELPAMLSAADLFVVLIEADAGVFSVPSKVLSYACIGRPILGFIPAGNLARKILLREGSGIAADPDAFSDILPSLTSLLTDADRRAEMGRNGRAYAERAFDIEVIADRFEKICAA